jgi:hypothetical protein
MDQLITTTIPVVVTTIGALIKLTSRLSKVETKVDILMRENRHQRNNADRTIMVSASDTGGFEIIKKAADAVINKKAA